MTNTRFGSQLLSKTFDILMVPIAEMLLDNKMTFEAYSPNNFFFVKEGEGVWLILSRALAPNFSGYTALHCTDTFTGNNLFNSVQCTLFKSDSY